MVPKSLYRTAEELESEEHRLLTDSIYKSASIFKGAPYEVQSLFVNQHPDPHESEREATFRMLDVIPWIRVPPAGRNQHCRLAGEEKHVINGLLSAALFPISLHPPADADRDLRGLLRHHLGLRRVERRCDLQHLPFQEGPTAS